MNKNKIGIPDFYFLYRGLTAILRRGISGSYLDFSIFLRNIKEILHSPFGRFPDFSIFRNNSTTFIIMKLFLIVFLIIFITILLHRYTSIIDSSNDKKMKRVNQERVDKFIEKLTSKEGFTSNDSGGYSTKDAAIFPLASFSRSPEYKRNPLDFSTEYLWENDTPSFSFENSSIFKSGYKLLYEPNDIIEGYQEGLDFNVNIPGLSDLIDGVNKIKEGFEKIMEIIPIINDIINHPLDNLENYILYPLYDKTIGPYLDRIKAKFDMLGDAVSDFKNATEDTATVFWNAVVTEATDTGELLKGVATCTGHYIVNLRPCLPLYLWDAFTSTLYHGLMIIPWFFEFITSIDIISKIDTLVGYIELLDDYMRKAFGFSFLHYPKSIINTCYRCGEVDFNSLIGKFNSDNEDINQSFNNVAQEWNSGGEKLMNFFTKPL